MSITIKFPTVTLLKMEHLQSAEIEVAKDDTLLIVKEKIFHFFWEKLAWMSPIGKHGKPEDVVLKDRDVEITTDSQLQQKVKELKEFQVVFKGKHPNLRPSF